MGIHNASVCLHVMNQKWKPNSNFLHAAGFIFTDIYSCVAESQLCVCSSGDFLWEYKRVWDIFAQLKDHSGPPD